VAQGAEIENKIALSFLLVVQLVSGHLRIPETDCGVHDCVAMLHVEDYSSSSSSSSSGSDSHDALIDGGNGKRKRGDRSRERSVASRSEQSYFAPSAAGSALSAGSPARGAARDEAAAEVALVQITEMTTAIDRLLQGGPNDEQPLRENAYQYSAFQTANSIGPGGLHTLRGESESTGVKGVPDPVPIEREGDVEKGAAVQYILSTPRAGEQTIVVDPDGVATAPGALKKAGNQHVFL